MMRAAERFEGKVGLVVGVGAGGMGRSVAVGLASEGASVVVADASPDACDGAVDEIRALGADVLGHVVDATNEADVVELAAAVEQRFEHLDLVFNNFALPAPARAGRDLGVAEMDADFWDWVMRVNVRGVMLSCKHAIPLMTKSDGGSIVNMGSISGIVAEPIHVAYGVSKAAVMALTRYLASAYGRAGIRANSVAPGYILAARDNPNDNAEWRAVREQYPMTGRFGAFEDVARVVLFLLSDDAAHVSGQSVVVDGGALLQQPGVVELQARGAYQ